jgi:hypothetical protein
VDCGESPNNNKQCCIGASKALGHTFSWVSGQPKAPTTTNLKPLNVVAAVVVMFPRLDASVALGIGYDISPSW